MLTDAPNARASVFITFEANSTSWQCQDVFEACALLLHSLIAEVDGESSEPVKMRATIGSERGCCVDCVFRTIEMTFKKKPGATTVKCPRCSGCEFSLKTVRNFLESDQVDAESARPLLAHIDELELRTAVLAHEKASGSVATFEHCIGPNCNEEFLFSWSSNCSLVSCRSCKFNMCVVCKTSYHFGVTCQELLPSRPSLVWRHTQTRACPNCHTSIEKNGGCSHHVCLRCGVDFDWTRAPVGVFGISQMTRALKSVPMAHRQRTPKKVLKPDEPQPPSMSWAAQVTALAAVANENVPIYMRAIQI
jgi:hypothetical protein